MLIGLRGFIQVAKAEHPGDRLQWSQLKVLLNRQSVLLVHLPPPQVSKNHSLYLFCVAYEIHDDQDVT